MVGFFAPIYIYLFNFDGRGLLGRRRSHWLHLQLGT